MYTPAAFKVENLDRLHRLIKDQPFGILLGQGSLEAAHVPFVLNSSPEPNGALLFHVARANPIWKQFDGTSQALAIFSGPHSYISPDWYGAENQVPTWNYAAVHAYGIPEVVEDQSEIVRILDLLTDHEETRLSKTAWRSERLAQTVYEKLQAAIVSLRMPITRFEGKWKFNQNKTEQQRSRVVDALIASGGSAGLDVARLMKELDQAQN